MSSPGAGLAGPVGVVLPAAGSGERMGGVRKPFLELAGTPVLLHALRPFLEHPRVEAIRIALPASVAADPPAWIPADPRLRIVPGGASRGESVLRGLEALPEGIEVVLVHDAARPFVDRPTIDRVLEAIGPEAGAVAGLPVTDTLKETDPSGRVLATPDRRRFWGAQTPQGFPFRPLLQAVREAPSESDDAAAFERRGGTVVMVEGSPSNLKITRPEDLRWAEAVIRP